MLSWAQVKFNIAHHNVLVVGMQVHLVFFLETEQFCSIPSIENVGENIEIP